MKTKKINVPSLCLKLVVAWFLIAFVVYPNLNLLFSTFYKNGELSVEAFSKIWASERAVNSLKNSLILGAALSVTVNIVGILVVLFTEYFDIKGSKILKAGYMTSLIYGGVTLVSGYKFVYGKTGVLTQFMASVIPHFDVNWFQGFWAVLFLMTFACTSNHIMFLTSAVRGLDYHVIEASTNMGASSYRTFVKVVLPMLKPTLFAVTILTFLTGLSALSAPLIVGGSDFQTINPMIITFASSSYSREIAAVLAIFLGVATIILLAIFTKVEKKGHYISLSKTKAKMKKQKIQSKSLNILAHSVAWFLWLIYIVPIVLVIVYSFSDSLAIKTGTLDITQLTFENYANLFTQASAYKPYIVSIIYSLLAAVIGVAICVVIARVTNKSKSRLDSLLGKVVLIPWLLPSTLIALGMMLTFSEPRWIVGNNVLVGTSSIMLLAYIVVKLPFSYRMIRASFFGVGDDLEEVAKTLGSSSFNTMRRVILPLIMPVVVSVIVLNFNSMLAEYDLSAFLYNPFLKPLGIVIKSASEDQATLDAQAMSFVYAVIIMIISTISLYFGRGEGVQKTKALYYKVVKKMKKK